MKTKYLFFIFFAVLNFLFGYAETLRSLNIDSLLIEQNKSEKTFSAIDQYNKNINYTFQADFPEDKVGFLTYITNTINIAHEIDYEAGEAQASYSLGKFYIAGYSDYSHAIPALLKSLTLFQNQNDSLGVAKCYMQLGLIGYITQYFEDALKNFDLSLAYHDYGTSIYLMAITYTEMGEFDKAKLYFLKALQSFEASQNEKSIMECHLYLGRMYVTEGVYDSGYYYLNKALMSKIAQEDRALQSRPFALLGEYYLRINQIDSALYYSHLSFDTVRTRNDKMSPVIAANVLSKAYEQKREFEKAHNYLKLYIALKNENMKGDTKQKIAEMQSMFEFEKQMALEKVRHEEEIRQENRKKNILLISGGFVLLIAGGLFSRLQYVRKSKAALQHEKNISENLLLNILPSEIARELKESGEAKARDFDMVSILFTDFKSFTETAENLSAQELVEEINDCFQVFDKIIEKYGVEKIKTIGDAYMAAGGLPVPTDDSIKNTVLAALELQAFITKRKAQRDLEGKPAFEMRVGIHTGPVVAGIVGVKKFQYDIWGDTVNTASRMESSGEVGKVNISQATYELLKDDPDFTFESRGKLTVKGKGEMEMWFVELSSGILKS